MMELEVNTRYNEIDAVGRNANLFTEVEGELCARDNLSVTCSQFFNPGETDLSTSCAVLSHDDNRVSAMISLEASESVPPAGIDTTFLWVGVQPSEVTNGVNISLDRSDTDRIDAGEAEVRLRMDPPYTRSYCDITRTDFDEFYYDQYLAFADRVMATE